MARYLTKKLAVILLALAVIAVVADSVWRKTVPEFSPCDARGAIDAPKIVEAGSTGIDGWAADTTGISRVEIWAGGKLIAGAKPSIARADVAAAFPQCKFPLVSGYAFARGIIPPTVTALEVRAVNGDGKSFKLGQVPVDFSRPFGMLDVSDAMEADGRNLISGWAVAGQGAVKVRVLAGDLEVLALPAGNLRDDVAKVFPAWPQAASSGFEGLLLMRKLPRGSYRLRILFEDEKGHSSEIVGPQVVNDLPFGKMLAQKDKMMPPETIELRAWLADEEGIRGARIETETGAPLGKMMLAIKKMPLSVFYDPRFNRDKAGDSPLKEGDLYGLHLPFSAIPRGLQRLQVRVEDKAGNVAVLPGPLVVDRNQAARQACAGEKLRVFYPGGAVDFRSGFRQMSELRAMAQGGCVEVGMRGRTEYLRTTFGKKQDFRFDPDFPEALRKRSDALEMTGESIRELLNTALRFKAPLMVTLDGGVWADAKFSAPDVDVVDNLEEDPRTVQWNQFGRPEPDDALEHLPGATASPQLARMMSLNRYNEKFLAYKKRNLQSAIGEIVQFMRKHPQIYVAVNLDPDQYINPWFYQTQWYDYNPDTLRQFREWLFHLGPYADGGELAFSRGEARLSLAQVNQIAKQSWKTPEEVDPPRGALNYSDPWQQLWTQFKRHLVARHYDDLAEWAAQAGMPEDRIFTSQTFIQTEVATRISDPATGWTDQAGVSIEGAKPRRGRLGAILYGPASRNEGKVRSGTTLIDNIRRIDPEWGVVEFHPATIAFPDKLPTHAESYTTLFRLINGGARFLSPMWGSYAGDRTVHPGHFKAYDAMEGTAYEYQLVWWLREMRFLPVGGRFYPFGNELVRSADGWKAGAGTNLDLDPGAIHLSGNAARLSLVSPAWENAGIQTGSRLEVQGKWNGRTAPDLVLRYQDGRSARLSPVRSGPNLAVFQLAPSSPLREIELEWKNSIGGAKALKPVAVDKITVTAHADA